MADFVKLETGALRSFGIDEKWLQDRIVEDPEILGIPEVFLRDRERRQIRAGRLDVLLETADNEKRYEVEIQLGATDESHIIRTIEYWDLERQRYPQYEHCAVIVAEDITSRFFNVIGLFNRHIPIIAINVTAVRQSDNTIGLVFTRVLDENRRAKEDSSGEQVKAGSKEQWVSRYGEKAAEVAEYLCQKLGTASRYTKFYIGMDDNNVQLRNKVVLRRYGQRHKPKIRICFTMEQTPEWNQRFDKDDLCAAEDWRVFDDESGYAVEVTDTKQIDDSLDLLRRLYREAAGFPQPPQITAAESGVAD